MRDSGLSIRMDPRSWPITFKAPMLVVIMMLAVGAAVTDRVLRRVEATQTMHLKELASTYMDGLSALVAPHVMHHDTWEVFDALERAARGYGSLELMWTTVVTPTGIIIASSQPALFPADSEMTKDVIQRFHADAELVLADKEERAYLRRILIHQGRAIGAIYVDLGISRLLKERREVLVTLLLTNAALILAFALLGYLLVRWMIGPVKVLAHYLGRARTRGLDPIPASLMPRAGSEFARLFHRYNEVAREVAERELLATRLAQEEKLASLGRLTSGIAHEINNPLGGLFNAIDTLKKHGASEDVRRKSISLLERGLAGIRDVVRAALHVYRIDKNPRPLTSVDIEDLGLLIRPELKRKRLRIDWSCNLAGSLSVSAPAVRDIALNLLLNACAASPEGGCIEFVAERKNNFLSMRITDKGAGLPEQSKSYLESAEAGKAPIEERGGLGLWMVRRLADELGATVSVTTAAGSGTVIDLNIPLHTAEGMRHVA